MEFNLATFADTKYAGTLNRIKHEAVNLNLFNNIFTWNEHDLDDDFVKNHIDFINKNKRGYGYWIWKPQIILQALKKTPKGSVLVYCDAGCSLNPSGMERLLEYGKMVQNHPSGILSFQLSTDDNIESRRTKMDLMNYLNYLKPEELLSYQVCATAMIIHNTDTVYNFVSKWLDTCVIDNYRYVDDSPSIIPNSNIFAENRHDQSIFSILCKQNQCLMIPDETNNHQHNPIYAARLKF